ncbi:MAG TPA: CHRD domain-containing protein, partial [Deinococcales bacterium]|nr:CHRD domain-containing protein [Deinococcales bacterium]
SHSVKADVRYFDLKPSVKNSGVGGQAVMITQPDGNHDLLLRVVGLPKGTRFGAHIHYNDRGDATCAAQNGSKAIQLDVLRPPEHSPATAMSYTRISLYVPVPKGSWYVQVHDSESWSAQEIACGNVEEVKVGKR